MNRKVLPTKEAYSNGFKILEDMKYRKMKNFEIKQEISDKQTVTSYPIKGKGYGFKTQYVFEIKTIRIEINTNYSDAIGGPDPKGHISLFLKDSRTKDRLTSFDILMGEHAIEKMLNYAEAFLDIALNWPEDPECGNPLMLCHIKGVMHAMYFTCKTREPKHVHKLRRVEIYFTDIPGLSEKSKKFLDKEFNRNASYTAWQRKKGKDVTPLRVKRSTNLKQKAP